MLIIVIKYLNIHDNFDTYIKCIINNVNPNKSYVKLSFSRRLKSNIIEDYGITLFFVVERHSGLVFDLHSADESLKILTVYIDYDTDLNKYD